MSSTSNVEKWDFQIIEEGRYFQKKKKKNVSNAATKKNSNDKKIQKTSAKAIYDSSPYGENSQRNNSVKSQNVMIKAEDTMISEKKKIKDDVIEKKTKQKTIFEVSISTETNLNRYNAWMKKSNTIEDFLLTNQLSYNIDLRAIPGIKAFIAFEKAMHINNDAVMKWLQKNSKNDYTKSFNSTALISPAVTTASISSTVSISSAVSTNATVITNSAVFIDSTVLAFENNAGLPNEMWKKYEREMNHFMSIFFTIILLLFTSVLRTRPLFFCRGQLLRR